MAVNDQEPRYRLVDDEGNVVGTIYWDGSNVSIQEGENQNEASIKDDGTFDVPAVGVDVAELKDGTKPSGRAGSRVLYSKGSDGSIYKVNPDGTEEQLGGGGGGIPAGHTWGYLNPIMGTWSGAAAFTDGYIYYHGGFQDIPMSGVEKQTSLYEYDVVNGNWTSLTDSPNPRANHSATFYDGKLYITGGDDNAFSNSTVSSYDPGSDSWNEGLSDAPGKIEHSATVRDGSDWIFAGTYKADDVVEGHVLIYDLENDTWSEGTPMGTAVGKSAGVMHDGLMWVIGGDDASSMISTVKTYDPDGDSWDTSPEDLSLGISSPVAASINGNIHLFGGQDESTPLDPIRILQDFGPFSSWTRQGANTMPSAVSQMAHVNRDGVHHFIGGYDGSASISMHAVYYRGSKV